MENNATNRGLPSAIAGNNSTQQSNLWRPWNGNKKAAPPTTHPVHWDLSNAKQGKAPQVIHPVKLFWPKAKCFDYLYRDAEMLLRNYPVQATICPYEDSSSDEEGDDEEEQMEKEQN
ncbi:protein ripply2 [Melanotaenia boesemani]|uniref:protein ripply2 n=1 Tax=Melanotaenia boesemani TaxID=1250792 RepID=UPI001C0437E0|nr:protein ripply2 [Melanotaenia boesemani]